MRPTATTRLFALIGDPVDHSLSPVMQNAAFSALGIDAVYVAVRADHGAVPHLVQAFEAVGVAGNVTVPHKIEVARLLIRVTSLARTGWPASAAEISSCASPSSSTRAGSKTSACFKRA